MEMTEMQNGKIRRINELFMKTIPSTRAHLVYRGEYSLANKSLVQKARECNEFLTNKMTELGFDVPNKGDFCPYTTLIKEQEYGLKIGASLDYERQQVNKMARVGDYSKDSTYTKSQKNTGRFPLYKDLIFINFDLNQLYVRAYPINDGGIKPEAKFFKGDEEISKYAFAPWAKSKDFTLWSGGEVKRSAMVDENGKPINDRNGKQIELAEMIDIKIQNCKIIVNNEDILPKMFELVSFYSTEELEKMRDAFLARCNAE